LEASCTAFLYWIYFQRFHNELHSFPTRRSSDLCVFALGVFEVTAETPTGLTVDQLTLTEQLLAPAGMTHEGATVRVPDIVGVGGWEVLTSELLSDCKLVVGLLVANCTALLKRKN